MKKKVLWLVLVSLPWSVFGQSVLEGLSPAVGLYLPPFGEYRRLLEVKRVSSVAEEEKGIRLGLRQWDAGDLPLFCRLEVQIERVLRRPVRIRLGDVDYVDWLEGKRRNN
jgi:hypothetical protein